jgi:hypothetical protein
LSSVETATAQRTHRPLACEESGREAATAALEDDWEVIEETTLSATQAMVVSALDGTVCTTIDPVPAGTYRVRAHARGRDTHYGLDVDDIVEDYLICLWPNDTHTKDSQVRTLHKTDTAWSPQPQIDRPEPSRAYVYIRDESGKVITVPPQSREALCLCCARPTPRSGVGSRR